MRVHPSQGFVLDRAGLQAAGPSGIPANFEECIFRVCPTMGYEATTQTRSLTRQKSMTEEEMKNIKNRCVASAPRGVMTHCTLTCCRARTARSAQVEKLKNQATLARLDEELNPELLYGQKIQLQHMMSGKFLSGVRMMAKMQKENLRLILEEGGSSCSAFRIKPRYKFRTEGDTVYADDQVRPALRARARARLRHLRAEFAHRAATRALASANGRARAARAPHARCHASTE